MIKHFTLVVSGRVQGVFYRASAKEIAEQLDIKGFAQNQSDGSVYIEAEGEEGALNKFIHWCENGPPRAEVANLIVTEEALKNFKGFEIRR